MKNDKTKKIIICLIIGVIIIAILSILESINSTKIILKQKLKIEELQNKVYQQYELIDALQQ